MLWTLVMPVDLEKKGKTVSRVTGVTRPRTLRRLSQFSF